MNIELLIAEDHAETRALLKIFLERAGADVVAVGSGSAALAVIQTHHFDVVLCDIGMPDMDGYQLLQKIRVLEPEIGRQPAIACTAYVAPEDVSRSHRAGFQAHVAKPVNPPELVNTIVNVVSAGPQKNYQPS